MTLSANWFLEVGERIFSSLGPQTQAFVTGFMEERAELEAIDLTFIQTAYGFAPEALTPQHILERAPYGNPQATREALASAANRGWLERVGEGQYTLSARGKEMAKDFFVRADELVGDLAPAAEVDLARIVQLLQKVVDRARKLPEPQHKPALEMGALFGRGPDAPLMVQVRRSMLDLFAFRDDVHVAAWKPYDVAGHVWEAFTHVWRDEAGTAAELVEKLSYRHFDEAAYAVALKDLASRGWIADVDGRWVATQAGKRLRQEAEDVTNHLYDVAWTALREAEVEELRALLNQLAEAVARPEEGTQGS